MRKIIIILSACIVLLLLGYVGYRSYGVWKQGHWLSLAKSYAAKGDAQNEFLSLKQALHYNSKDLEACRMMADLAEKSRSPGAIVWRKRVLDLNPGSTSDRLALAQTAVLFGDIATATNALAGVDEAGRKTADYFNVVGILALSRHQLDEAEKDFAESARLQPENLTAQLNLAVIRLHRTNTLDKAEARITLERISQNTTNVFLRAKAQRELVLDALNFKDNKAALEFSKELAQSTNAPFSDKMMRLTVLSLTKNDEYKPTLAAYEQEASTDVHKLSQLTIWLMGQKKPAEALAWLQTIPAEIRTNLSVMSLSARCQMLLRDWSGLQNSVSKENWGDQEYIRHAYLSYGLREQGLKGASKAEWQVALTDANHRLDNLKTLLAFTASWHWQDEGQQILRTIVNNFPQEQGALRDLIGITYANGDTRSLMQLFNTQMKRNPNDTDAKNNLALTAMLLHAQEMNPYDLAYEAYQNNPTNSSYASTYAYGLHLQGKNADALKVMQKLSPDAQNRPSTAGYYGIILKATGNNAQAINYLKLALKSQLLPEERALFEQALSGN